MATTTNKTWQKDSDTTAIDQDDFINAFLDDLDASLFGRGANSAKPGSPNNGDTFYDTDASRFIKYNGSAWVQVMPDAVNVIDSDHYVDGSIDTVHLSADAVTGAKIADDAIDSEHYTDASIDAAHIASNAVTTVKINADAVTGAKIADDAIDSEHYTDGSIDAAHIASSAVTTAKINGDAVTGAKIADDALDSEHYTDGSIDSAHLASDVVTGAKIADDAVDSEHYTDGSIDTAHIADNQITLAKQAHGTQGGIQYYAASGAPAELAAGTDGYFLKTQGTSANPVWAASSSGPSQANQAALEAETNEDAYAPPDLIKHSPGVAKFWVCYNNSASIQDSYNMTSISDDGTGASTVTIATDFSNANWVYQANCDISAGWHRTANSSSRTAGVITMETKDQNANLGDPGGNGETVIVGFGDQ